MYYLREYIIILSQMLCKLIRHAQYPINLPSEEGYAVRIAQTTQDGATVLLLAPK